MRILCEDQQLPRGEDDDAAGRERELDPAGKTRGIKVNGAWGDIFQLQKLEIVFREQWVYDQLWSRGGDGMIVNLADDEIARQRARVGKKSRPGHA